METNKPTDSEETTPTLDSQTLERLYQATNELYAADTIEEGSQQTVSVALDIIGFDRCAITEADEKRGRFNIVAAGGDTSLRAGDSQFALDEGILGAAFAAGESRIDNETNTVDEAVPIDDHIQSALTVPIGDWGMFQALGRETGVFDETDLRLLELLLAPLAATVKRIQRETALKTRTEELRQQNRQIEAIHEVSTEMKRATKADDIYSLFVETVEQVLDIGISTLNTREGDLLKTRAVGSGMSFDNFYTETPLDQYNSLAVDTYTSGETYIIDDLSETEYRVANSTYRSLLSVPLGDWGVFQGATKERAVFDQTDRHLIELLADGADAAMERIDRENELERRAQQLEQQTKQLDQFASRLSHEMRNPLSVLKARTTLARETDDPEHFDHMDRSIRRMSRLIDDMLSLAREGSLDTVTEPVALDQCVKDNWQAVRTLNTNLNLETEARICADKKQLHQLFSNLFRNAIEHAGTDVTVTVGDVSDGFYIEDNGAGIPSENRDEVFATGTSDLPHGTGLGLAVVRRIAEAHGWSLQLSESDTGGARFEFRDVAFTDE
ncbi:GAF domain-containing sensor histidine kinase [Halovenus rubra]|uniref:histidine kinase n=2 Tax=Halovenus rubra TaxID=869890 RepID=A0ABD5X3J4_9EURY|nr:GAF domain-containing sensor histidine kinase [Halovenus rubra]